MKPLYTLFIFILLSGCGTVKTTAFDDKTISQKLTARNTNCDIIPRTYSGIAYNWCILDAKAINVKGWNPTLESTIVDILLSGLADTIILPYTLTKQFTVGSISLPNSDQ